MIIVTPHASSAQADPSATEVAAFLAADIDQSQTLSFDEFSVFVRLMAQQGQSTARTIRFWSAYRYAFGITDTNQDGMLDPAELAAGNQKHVSGG